jgi:uncharacterized membrane protein
MAQAQENSTRRSNYPKDRASRAAIAGHPLHPMLVPFPITLLLAALAADIGFWLSQDFFWARASLWLLGAGVCFAVAAAVLGLIDFLSLPAARQGHWGWLHGLGNGAALLLALINLAYRWTNPAEAIVPTGLVLSLLVAVILFVTAWAGGELVYRLGIGQFPSAAKASRAPERRQTGAPQA